MLKTCMLTKKVSGEASFFMDNNAQISCRTLFTR